MNYCYVKRYPLKAKIRAINETKRKGGDQSSQKGNGIFFLKLIGQIIEEGGDYEGV
jgi:hypothetical protein